MTFVTTLSAVMVGGLVYRVLASPPIESHRSALCIARLSRLVVDDSLTAEGYSFLRHGWLARSVIIGLVVGLVVAASLVSRRSRWRLKAFFTASAHPIDLAVFRIVLFYWIFHSVNVSRVVWFSQMPKAMLFPPWGTGWLLDSVPINESVATAACALLRVVSFTAMIGLFTRCSALFTAILAVYVLGIPHCFGQVNHNHHLVWFATLLAASPCGDTLSCDAMAAAWRRANQGVTDPPGRARVYGLPLRIVWLLIGIIYFFPGFWKWCASGMEWAWSENVKFYMYHAWAWRGG
jgi:hypothetical protein